MKTYSDYFKVLTKMEQIKNLLIEMDGKRLSEIGEEKRQQIQDLSFEHEYDEYVDMDDLFFIEPDDVFGLFEELGKAEEFGFDEEEIKVNFCLSFHYRWDDITVAYSEDIDKIIESYRAALEVFKAWDDEDNQEDEIGRTYNVLVIQESNRTYYIDSDGNHNYCWERQETIKTDYYEKLFAKVEEIQEKAAFDYYPEKIFIDLDTGEEIVLWDDYGYDTEPTDRAAFYLKELGYDE